MEGMPDASYITARYSASLLGSCPTPQLIQGAWRISDAIRGRRQRASYPATIHSWTHHCRSIWLRTCGKRAIGALLALSFFEAPMSIHFRPTRKDYASGAPCLPYGVSHAIQLIAYSVICGQLVWEGRGSLHPSLKRRRIVEWCAVTWGISGVIVVVAFGADMDHKIGLCFVCTSPFVRLASCLCVFVGWILRMLAMDLRMERHEAGDFDTLTGSIYELFIMWTTADVPNGFLPFFAKYRVTGLIIFPFLAATIFGLTNVCLALVYKGYHTQMHRRLTAFYQNRITGLTSAFVEICQYEVDQAMPPQTFANLIKILSGLPSITYTDRRCVAVLFCALDRDESGCLSLEEFCSFIEIMQYNLHIYARESWLMAFLHQYPCASGASAYLDKIRTFVTNDGIEPFMTTILCLNALLILFLSYVDLWGRQRPYWSDRVEFLFSVVYMLEIGLKLSIMRWKQYWNTRSNRFDFITSCVFFAAGAPVFPASARRYCSILRALRLLRLLSRWDQMRFTCLLFVRIIAVSQDVLIFVFCVFYFYASVGVVIFGSVLDPKDPRIANSLYVQHGLVYVNFNDFIMAFCTLFSLMITDYIEELVDALSAVASSHGYPSWFPYVYFTSWYVCSVILCFNILVAFCIDVLTTLATEEEAGEKREDGSHHEQMRRFSYLQSELWNDGWIIQAEMSFSLQKTRLCDRVFQTGSVTEECSLEEEFLDL
eukprot:GEMP01013712.1.p1 GENE.GEMP01013712.1~~GEMP01013712.1.p1  ORF type:complete len:712 (+),score=102.27 GEMP01013712.1:314-2449(+)